MSRYLHGTDVLGEGDQYLVIRVKNVPELVKSQGGSTGAFVQTLVPQTIQNKVYSEMQKQMVEKFKEQGVDADVKITYAPPPGGPPRQDFFVGAVIGAGAVGVGVLFGHFLKRLLKRQ